MLAKANRGWPALCTFHISRVLFGNLRLQAVRQPPAACFDCRAKAVYVTLAVPCRNEQAAGTALRSRCPAQVTTNVPIDEMSPMPFANLVFGESSMIHDSGPSNCALSLYVASAS